MFNCSCRNELINAIENFNKRATQESVALLPTLELENRTISKGGLTFHLLLVTSCRSLAGKTTRYLFQIQFLLVTRSKVARYFPQKPLANNCKNYVLPVSF